MQARLGLEAFGWQRYASGTKNIGLFGHSQRRTLYQAVLVSLVINLVVSLTLIKLW